MKIRFGTYTLVDGIEMGIFGFRYEVPIPEGEKKYGISYPCDLGLKDGFKKLPHNVDRYYKELYLRDIKNAFFVTTKTSYNGEIFEVEPYNGDDIHLHIATKDIELGKKLNFYKLHDGYGEPYYLGEIKITKIEKLWEVRSKSEYDLPLPEGLELYKEIEIPKSI